MGELFNLRMLMVKSNLQIEEMGCMKPPMDPLYNIVGEESVTDTDFRKKFHGDLHFLCPVDDIATPWEFCALMAERTGATMNLLESGMGDHAMMMISPKVFHASLREVLEFSWCDSADEECY